MTQRTAPDMWLDPEDDPRETGEHEAWAAWRREVKAADEWLAGDISMDAEVQVGDDVTHVRDVLVHMVEEYARHAGHADLLRERIDGRTGQ